MENQQEIWLPIIGYDGVYEVSNKGHVRKLSSNGKIKNLRTTVINNYERVHLFKNKVRETLLVKYVVARAFIPNPKNYKKVTYINRSVNDNSFTNLQWCYKIHRLSKILGVGKRFGELLLLKEIETTRSGAYRYECLCSCGGSCTVAGHHLLEGVTKSCGCLIKRRNKENKFWKGFGEISGGFWNTLMNNTTNKYSKTNKEEVRKAFELSIDIEYAWNLFLKQERKCALSGIELYFGKGVHDKIRTASLDRIDSSKGYIEGNVQWVHKHINMMKNRYKCDYFIDMCIKIANHQKKIIK